MEVLRNLDNKMVVFKSDAVVVFLDKKPRTRGHLIVATSKIYSAIFDSPWHIQEQFNKAVSDTIDVLHQFGAKGINIATSIGDCCGQEMEQAYIHLIPRFEKDNAPEIEEKYIDFPWRQTELSLDDREMQKIASELNKLFNCVK